MTVDRRDMGNKIIFFELNEVPFRIVDEFCRRRPGSCLARLLPRCEQYVTVSEDETHLSPWKTWPSVHRGVNDARHMIQDFGQNLTEADREFPPLWRLLTARGISTGVCGSLHSYPLPASLEHYAFYLPDAFAASPESFPEPLTAFQELNLKLARASARNVSTAVPWAAALRFLAGARELGIRAGTFGELGFQVLSERVQGWRKTRRRTYQAVLAFDVFMRQLRRRKPDFSTFFTNHVASAMHRYWAAAFPEDYARFDFSEEWVRTYRGEIEFAMGRFDFFFSILAGFVDDNPEYRLWVASSMGQAATVAEPLETQLYFTDLGRFMRRMGLADSQWSRRPAMAPDYSVVVADSKAAAFREALSKLAIEGQPVVFRQGEEGFFHMSFGQPNLHAKGSCAAFDGRPLPFEELGLSNVEIEDKSSSCAYHIPEGSLWIYDPTRPDFKPGRVQVSALDLAPAILANFSVPAPGYMRRPAPIGVSK